MSAQEKASKYRNKSQTAGEVKKKLTLLSKKQVTSFFSLHNFKTSYKPWLLIVMIVAAVTITIGVTTASLFGFGGNQKQTVEKYATLSVFDGNGIGISKNVSVKCYAINSTVPYGWITDKEGYSNSSSPYSRPFSDFTLIASTTADKLNITVANVTVIGGIPTYERYFVAMNYSKSGYFMNYAELMPNVNVYQMRPLPTSANTGVYKGIDQVTNTTNATGDLSVDTRWDGSGGAGFNPMFDFTHSAWMLPCLNFTFNNTAGYNNTSGFTSMNVTSPLYSAVAPIASNMTILTGPIASWSTSEVCLINAYFMPPPGGGLGDFHFNVHVGNSIGSTGTLKVVSVNMEYVSMNASLSINVIRKY